MDSYIPFTLAGTYHIIDVCCACPLPSLPCGGGEGEGGHCLLRHSHPGGEACIVGICGGREGTPWGLVFICLPSF